MALLYQKGDLLKTTDPFIAHSANIYAKMGAGVAKAIADAYPWQKEKLETAMRWEIAFWGGKGLLPGEVYEFAKRTAPYRILHVMGQEFYGRKKMRYVSYDMLDKGFQKVKTIIKDQPISIPKLGVGLGGGEWEIVSAIVNFHLKDNQVTVWEL